ncbi:MAG TPA: pyrophosphatase [Devosiaceae bacterium]|jgi:NTP pyrophosphatase (non-canonical NTP hydrolase)
MGGTVTELSERIEQVSRGYARRCNIERNDDWFVLKLQEEAGELVSDYLRLTGRGRDKGLSADEVRANMADEAADLFAHVLLFCRHNGIDIESAVDRKWFRYLDKPAPVTAAP